MQEYELQFRAPTIRRGGKIKYNKRRRRFFAKDNEEARSDVDRFLKEKSVLLDGKTYHAKNAKLFRLVPVDYVLV